MKPTTTSDIVANLNKQQKQAVLYNHYKNGPLLIIAGAGTGKTSVLCQRIKYLLSNNVLPHQILALTFTVKAAQEMKERVIDFKNNDLQEKMQITTFHSLALRLLLDQIQNQENYKLIGLKHPPTFNEMENDLVFKSLKKDCGVNYTESEVANFRENIFNPQFIWPKDLDNINPHKLAYKALNNGRLIFEDLIHLATKLLRQNHHILLEYQEKVQYILIDEYQDINPSQYQLVRLMLGDKKNLFAVGDDDQAIYAFRGADINNILMFKKDFPDSKIIKLEQNYRSTPSIIKMANRVFTNKPSYLQKKLISSSSNSSKIFSDNLKIDKWKSNSMLNEVRKIVDYINFAINHYNLNWCDFAIIARYNRQVDNYKQALTYFNIPILSDNPEKENIESTDGVIIQTIHASKGLQYPVVFYVGLMSDISPSAFKTPKLSGIKSKTKTQIKQLKQMHYDEEKRLFYVGITRAESKLILLTHTKAVWKAKLRTFKISPFFKI